MGQLHIFVCTPIVADTIDWSEDWHVTRTSRNLDRYVSFVAPSRGWFGELVPVLAENNIFQSRNLPDNIIMFQSLLSNTRKLNDPSNTVLRFHLGQSFEQYFSDVFTDDEEVTNPECHCYTSVFESPKTGIYAGEAYQTAPEMLTHFLLLESAFNIRQCLDNTMSYSFGRLWPFPLIAEVFEDAQAIRYNYRPKSDFSFSPCDIPIIILEVCSDKHAQKLSESDRPRLLLQAACLVHLWNHLLGGRDMVIMTVYVDKDFAVSRYLLFQDNDSNSARVEYVVQEFDLRIRLQAFEFLFQFYNFVSGSKTNAIRLTHDQNGTMLVMGITRGLQSFTSKSTKRPRQGGPVFYQPRTSHALAQRGYHIQVEDEIEGWTPLDLLKPTQCRAESKHGLVMLKLLDKASDELRIPEALNRIGSEANHVIPVLGSFHLDIGTAIALPIASPLDSRRLTSSSVALDLMHQLTRAIAFIHVNGVAHLDLKPSNLLVSCTADRPRLVMIDFDVSVFVDSPDTQIEGFVGTAPWVVPEVGTEHGSPQGYNQIRANLWACGRVLLYMASRSCVRDTALAQLARDLSSDDPLPHQSREAFNFQPTRDAATKTHMYRLGQTWINAIGRR